MPDGCRKENIHTTSHPSAGIFVLVNYDLLVFRATQCPESMIRKLRLFGFFFLIAAGACFPQSVNDSSHPGGDTGVNCSDPFQASSPECMGLQGQIASSARTSGSAPSIESVPQLRSPSDANQSQYPPGVSSPNPSQIARSKAQALPETEFEQMVADSAGRPLPLFGQSLFEQPPSTFAPLDLLQVPSDYIIGPGDELQIRIWGQLEANLRVTVDRSGQIYIPRVGQVTVTGVHYNELEQYLRSEVSRIFRNFNLAANVGRLRSIQVLVVGNARYPGTYTISSLSTLVNAVFASGGPSPQGSLRHIQVRRDGATITDFDFYDLLIKGDKSKDVRLQPGDVLYIPTTGPLAAISGSVNTPAIYELKGSSTLSELVEIAGGMSSLADTGRITVERVVDHQSRKALEFPYDDATRVMPLQDGDIVRILSIVPSFQDTVTLRGNVANPGRYPWKQGMRVRDLIPKPEALLTRRYWLDRAAIGNGLATEYPIGPRRPAEVRCLTGSNPSAAQAPASTAVSTVAAKPSIAVENTSALPSATDSSEVVYVPCEPGQQVPSNTASGNSDRVTLGNRETAEMHEEIATTQRTAKSLTADLRRHAPEINWDYAIIQRVNPTDLSSKLIWMSPRKAILEHDDASNVELQPGDIITIFSQRDISLPQDERSRYVVLEGEVRRPGVYKLEVDESLHSVLQRAGGLTPNAYVYGSQLLRESARIEQQNSLDQLVHTMEVQVRQSALSIAASSAGGDAQALAQLQEGIVSQLRAVRATGRVALPVKASDKNLTDFPNMVMEDNDRLIIPHTPSTISVVGNVYNPGSFIFDPHTKSGAYLEMAGKGKPQSDMHHAFVLRANGVVVAANNVNGLFTSTKFDHLRLYPGDEIIVPYKLPTGAFVRGLRDWSQIASQLAITAAALAVVVP
jgi:protein involved in polysaccharide export with SLBB domain